MRSCKICFLIVVFLSCVVLPLTANEDLPVYSQDELEILGSREAKNGMLYKYPTIMIESDFHVSKVVKGREYPSLGRSLLYNEWELEIDDQGRLYKFISPELTYSGLKKLLNFHDRDIFVNKNRKTDEPHAYILTDWATCEIYYVNKTYDGSDSDVRLTAIVFDNDKYQQHLEHQKLEEETGWFGRLLSNIMVFLKNI